MMRTLLVRGLIAGLIAGIAAAVFAYVTGEPHVDAAIAIEEANSGADAAHHEEELVGRTTQATSGLLVANGAFGVALGGLFALVFAGLHGRFGAAGARTYSALIAAGGFLTVTLVPFLKYPANPPAVGQEGTIAHRTELYFTFLGLSFVAACVALAVARVLAGRLGGWLSGTVAACGYLVLVATAGLLLPAVNEVPDDFPATVLWDFRLASLGSLVVMWSVLGAGFSALAHRALTAQRLRQEAEPVTV